MKLLLTSAGISNNSIKEEFIRLSAKKTTDLIIGFVPTAGLVTGSNAKWFVDEMLTFRSLEPAEFIIIDFNLLAREEIIKRLNKIDVLALSGGSSSAILHAIETKDRADALTDFSKEHIYCGVSASTHIVCPDLALSNSTKIEDYSKTYGFNAKEGLGWVDFYIRSHFGEERYPDLTDTYMQKKASELGQEIYGMDDQSAISVEGGNLKVISEGKYKIFKPE